MKIRAPHVPLQKSHMASTTAGISKLFLLRVKQRESMPVIETVKVIICKTFCLEVPGLFLER